jgi:hypothetical protein
MLHSPKASAEIVAKAPPERPEISWRKAKARFAEIPVLLKEGQRAANVALQVGETYQVTIVLPKTAHLAAAHPRGKGTSPYWPHRRLIEDLKLAPRSLSEIVAALKAIDQSFLPDESSLHGWWHRYKKHLARELEEEKQLRALLAKKRLPSPSLPQMTIPLVTTNGVGTKNSLFNHDAVGVKKGIIQGKAKHTTHI